MSTTISAVILTLSLATPRRAARDLPQSILAFGCVPTTAVARLFITALSACRTTWFAALSIQGLDFLDQSLRSLVQSSSKTSASRHLVAGTSAIFVEACLATDS